MILCFYNLLFVQDVPVNDIRYLPHNYKFNTDKTERPTWPTTKATPTKKYDICVTLALTVHVVDNTN